MDHTCSATELMPVVVEPNGVGGADVWLNRNITITEIDLGGGLSQAVWEAEQVHYIADNVPTANEVDADFDAIWREHVGASDVSIAELEDALADLSEVSSDNATLITELSDALAELSEIISEAVNGGDE